MTDKIKQKSIMKKIILLVLVTFAFANGYSQEKGRFRVGLDFGYVPTGGGGMVSMEPKFNLTDNMNVGLRLGGAGIARDIETSNGQSTTAKISAKIGKVSFVPYMDLD